MAVLSANKFSFLQLTDYQGTINQTHSSYNV